MRLMANRGSVGSSRGAVAVAQSALIADTTAIFFCFGCAERPAIVDGSRVRGVGGHSTKRRYFSGGLMAVTCGHAKEIGGKSCGPPCSHAPQAGSVL